MKPRILPCPFCGETPRFTFVPASFAKPELDRAFYSLSCHRPKNLCPGIATSHGETKLEAIVAWNTRVPTFLEGVLAAGLREAQRGLTLCVKHLLRTGPAPSPQTMADITGFVSNILARIDPDKRPSAYLTFAEFSALPTEVRESGKIAGVSAEAVRAAFPSITTTKIAAKKAKGGAS